MCGRFTQTQSAEAIATLFQLAEPPTVTPSYNIAPTQSVGVIVATVDQPAHQFRPLRWGLIPSWAKDPSMGNRLINARSETVAEKPAFRSAFRQRRCLVLADGFYEWRRSQGQKQPFYFHLREQPLFAFAGLWEQWHSPEGEAIASCTILTTAANELLSQVHDRMPVILAPNTYDQWLDPTLRDPERLKPLLQPYPATFMDSYPVSSQVNSPRHNSPDCIQAIAAE